MADSEYLLGNYSIKKICNKPIRNKPGDLLLFVVMRNERLRLPCFLNHYFTLGIDKIFVLDNDSTDQTVPFLLSQENVYVFQTKCSFKFKADWLSAFMSGYGSGHWCVLVDADELFIYPYWEYMGIKALCNYLDMHHSNALCCHLLDMYSDKRFDEIEYRMDNHLLAAARFFDPGPYYYLKILEFLKYGVPYHIYGGMRKRVFDVDVCQTKFPLVKNKEGIKVSDGTHTVINCSISQVQGALLHFKFLQDFKARVNEEVTRGVHYMDAGEYRYYSRKLMENPELTLYYEGAKAYENSAQLVDLGIMRITDDFENFFKEFPAKRKFLNYGV